MSKYKVTFEADDPYYWTDVEIGMDTDEVEFLTYLARKVNAAEAGNGSAGQVFICITGPDGNEIDTRKDFNA